ncbi:hypothetical protein ANTQUA_LOCUS10034 [Anthophora quadrimaculata]
MMLILGECNRNAREAANLYAAKYPERHHPSAQTFYSIEKNLRSYGEFQKKRRSKPITIEGNVVTVLAHVEENLHTSIRTISVDTGLSKSSAHRIIRKNNYHPYKMSKVHLRETNSQCHLHFISWLVISYEDNPEILNYILWTDECKFSWSNQ